MAVVNPEISVVICTLDRPDLVRLALESLAVQRIDPPRYEVLVVDNGSGTVAAELTAAAADAPNVHIVHEPVMGLSHARNRGAREASGRVVLFMDDDALADPDLLEAHLRQFDADPCLEATGGRIYLRWPTVRPAWVPASLETYYSGLDLGDEPQELQFPMYPYGANMAVRRDVLLEVGGFSTELGRRGRNLISGEEKDLFLRVSKHGGRVAYVPDAVVHHCVLPDRTSRRWLLRRSWAQGRSDIVMGQIAGDPLGAPRLLARALLHAWRGLTYAGGAVLATVAHRPEVQRMRRASQTLRWLGAAYEGMALALPRRGAVAH